MRREQRRHQLPVRSRVDVGPAQPGQAVRAEQHLGQRVRRDAGTTGRVRRLHRPARDGPTHLPSSDGQAHVAAEEGQHDLVRDVAVEGC